VLKKRNFLEIMLLWDNRAVLLSTKGFFFLNLYWKQIMETLNNVLETIYLKVGNFLPDFVGALVILLIGYLLAKGLKRLIIYGFSKTEIDERLAEKMGLSFRFDKFIGSIVYYIVIVYVLIIVLGMLGIDSVLAPLQNMLNVFLSYLPNMLGAGIIGTIGYVLAKLVSEGASALLGNTSKLLKEKSGMNFDVANVLKKVIFAFIFVPVLIVALEILQIRSISVPATSMLNDMMAAIPQIIAAMVILTVFYIVGKFVIGFIVDLLKGLGVDTMSEKIGIEAVIGKEASLSKIIGNVAFFFIMFSGVMSAVEKLELLQLSTTLQTLFVLSGRVFFGLIVLIFGNFVASLASRTVKNSQDNKWLPNIVYYTVLGLFLAITMDTIGVGEEIVNLAFGLILGAVAVAFALAFGLGGREAANTLTKRWLNENDEAE
jgi:hypothetical protein